LDVFEREIKSELEAKAEPEINEYLGNAVTITRDATGLGEVKITQPVLLQKMKDNCPPANSHIPRTPAAPGTELSKEESSKLLLGEEEAFKFRSLLTCYMYAYAAVESTRHFTAHSSSRLLHACSKGGALAGTSIHVGLHVWYTLNRGLTLRPVRLWDGSAGYHEFVISGRSDSNYAANIDDRCSVTGCRTQLKGDQSCRGAPLNVASLSP
jgi:hypothetical protein